MLDIIEEFVWNTEMERLKDEKAGRDLLPMGFLRCLIFKVTSYREKMSCPDLHRQGSIMIWQEKDGDCQGDGSQPGDFLRLHEKSMISPWGLGTFDPAIDQGGGRSKVPGLTIQKTAFQTPEQGCEVVFRDYRHATI
jgi:hypothetical protein